MAHRIAAPLSPSPPSSAGNDGIPFVTPRATQMTGLPLIAPHVCVGPSRHHHPLCPRRQVTRRDPTRPPRAAPARPRRRQLAPARAPPSAMPRPELPPVKAPAGAASTRASYSESPRRPAGGGHRAGELRRAAAVGHGQRARYGAPARASGGWTCHAGGTVSTFGQHRIRWCLRGRFFLRKDKVWTVCLAWITKHLLIARRTRSTNVYVRCRLLDQHACHRGPPGGFPPRP
jgi:hypothetical protein